jgi:hypothetical protein
MRLERQMDKDGIRNRDELDSLPHGVAVKRTAQELFSSRAALQTDGLSSPATLNIAARQSIFISPLHSRSLSGCQLSTALIFENVF